jgi:hypothetical protein
LGAARLTGAFFAGFLAAVFLRAAGLAADVFLPFGLPVLLRFFVAIGGLPEGSFH